MNANALVSSVGQFVSAVTPQPFDTPQLAQPKRSDDGLFTFQARLQPDIGYEIQASTDLQNWSSLSLGRANTETIDGLDLHAPEFNFRFYRVVAGGVESRNMVGYVSVKLAPGISMIANPLAADENTVAALLGGMPEGMAFCKFDTNSFRLTNNFVKGGKWMNPNDTLLPGDGAIVCNPTTKCRIATFVGEVSQGNLLKRLAPGFSIRSSLVPKSGRLNLDLNFPLADGDVIHLFDRDLQKYHVYPYPSSVWESNPPQLAVGESFWAGKKSASDWVQCLNRAPI